jgi:hypothetical protein
MSKPTKVRGLMGMFEAEARGEEWEMDEPSPDFVPGMGFGATKEATLYAFIGMQVVVEERMKKRLKRPAHRPKKEPFQSKDAGRAFHCWQIVQLYREVFGKDWVAPSNRELIQMSQDLENRQGTPILERYFNASEVTNEQSLSRGRKILEIDACWNSAVCEELKETFAQIT